MPIAVGVIETQGFPAVLAAADTMVKAGRVTLVVYERSEKGRQFVAVRGPMEEVERAVNAGIASVEAMPGVAEVTEHYIVPNPPDNLESVLPIAYTDQSDPFQLDGLLSPDPLASR